jgi:hypothetical protein
MPGRCVGDIANESAATDGDDVEFLPRPVKNYGYAVDFATDFRLKTRVYEHIFRDQSCFGEDGYLLQYPSAVREFGKHGSAKVMRLELTGGIKRIACTNCMANKRLEFCLTV